MKNSIVTQFAVTVAAGVAAALIVAYIREQQQAKQQ